MYTAHSSGSTESFLLCDFEKTSGFGVSVEELCRRLAH